MSNTSDRPECLGSLGDNRGGGVAVLSHAALPVGRCRPRPRRDDKSRGLASSPPRLGWTGRLRAPTVTVTYGSTPVLNLYVNLRITNHYQKFSDALKALLAFSHIREFAQEYLGGS